MAISKTLFERLGGKPTFQRVHKLFYDKVYAHPWLSLYFRGKSRQVLEDQQTDFMISIMGGPKAYMGRAPKYAHQHMMITNELFDLRQRLLSDAIVESGIADDLRNEWLAADNALRFSLVKKSRDECDAYSPEEILDFDNPMKGR